MTRLHLAYLSLALLASLDAASQGEDLRFEALDRPPALHEGLAAQASFDTVPASHVPSPPGESGTEVGIYPLDPDLDAYEVKDGTLEYLDSVTVAWGVETQSPFVFDLYLHGDLSKGDRLAFRLAKLDIRKFFYQSIAHLDEPGDLARLQAYFAEFSRKSKIIYRSQDSDRRTFVGFETIALDRLRMDLGALISSCSGSRVRLEAYERARQHLERGASGRDLSIVHQNLVQADRAIHVDAGTSSSCSELDEAHRVSLALDRVRSIGAARKISDVVLTNNCREPGNFEIGLRDAAGRYVLKGAFLLPPETYDRLLREFSGLGIADQGTGVRVSETLREAVSSGGDHASAPSSWTRALPRVRIDDLRALGAHGAETRKACRGAVQVEAGLIPYHEYELEVRRKSAAVAGAYHPLSFVRVDPRVERPEGFTAPTGEAAAAYWYESRNAGKAVPHRFATYEDVQSYDVHLSGFEVNGVYIGRTDLERFDAERQEGRWPFDFRHLRSLRRFELHTQADDAVEIRLLGDVTNFVLGNLTLEVGEEVRMQLGIGTQPLIAPYNENVYRDRLAYGLAFDGEGVIRDHHASEIGVEQVYIERQENPNARGTRTYRIRLVSHERIVPVWEGTIDTAQAECLSPP